LLKKATDHWLSGVETIFQSDTADLRRLAQLAGGDARTFYIGANLSGADLRGQDLSDFDLRGCSLKGALVDAGTRLPISAARQLSAGAALQLYSWPELGFAGVPVEIGDILHLFELLTSSKRFEEANFILEENILEYKNNPEFLIRLIRSLFNLNRDKEALEYVYRYLDSRGTENAKHFSTIIRLLTRRNHTDDMINILRRKIAEEPYGIELVPNLIFAFFRAGKYREVISTFEADLSEASHKGPLISTVAESYLAIGERDKAVEILEKFFSGGEAISWGALKKILLKADRSHGKPSNKEIELYIHFLREFGKRNPGPWKWLIDRLIDIKEIDVAIAVAEECYNTFLSHVDPTKWLLLALHLSGDLDRTRIVGEQSLRRHGDNAVVYKWLYDIAVLNGDVTYQQELRQRAFSTFPVEQLPWFKPSGQEASQNTAANL
jgi:tetratricopeptide (TPR) repeat protein